MKAIWRELTKRLPDDLGEEIATGAGIVFLIQVGGAGLNYLLQIVLARVLNADGYGVYSYVIGWIALLAVPASLGFSTSLVRFVSQYREQNELGLLQGITRRSWQIVAGTGILIGATGALLVSGLAERFAVPHAQALLIGMCVVPLRALLDVQVAVGRGLKRMVLAYLPQRILRPFLLLAGVVLLGAMGWRLNPLVALTIAVLSYFSTILIQRIWLFTQMPSGVASSRFKYRTRHWLRVSGPMLLISGFFVLLSRTDVVMLGMLARPDEVGLYNAAARTATVASFVVTAVNAIAGPSFASLYHEGTQDELQELASTVAHLMFWPSLLIVAALVVLAPVILGLFGQRFIAAEDVLILLAVGQVVNIGVGSVGYLMNMTGHQDEMARIVGIVAVVNVLLNAAAVPLFGAMGAAVATTISMASWNIWLNRRVVARLSIRPSILYALRRCRLIGSEAESR